MKNLEIIEKMRLDCRLEVEMNNIDVCICVLGRLGSKREFILYILSCDKSKMEVMSFLSYVFKENREINRLIDKEIDSVLFYNKRSDISLDKKEDIKVYMSEVEKVYKEFMSGGDE